MQLPKHFILIDKPKGITSFDVIRELRKRTGIKKWGHAGTLDPLATGLMLLAHDSGTKQLKDFVKLDKEYIADVRIGERRSTGDMEGDVVESVSTVTCTTSEIEDAVASLVDTLTLPVSAYSAIKKDGVAMYKRARKAEKMGETVEDVPVREMVVHEAELLHPHYVGGQTSNTSDASSSWRSDLQLGLKNSTVNSTNRCIVTVRFSVGSGTYIRSLAEELGRRLGYPATLQNLRRTKVGEFDVSSSQKLK